MKRPADHLDIEIRPTASKRSKHASRPQPCRTDQKNLSASAILDLSAYDHEPIKYDLEGPDFRGMRRGLVGKMVSSPTPFRHNPLDPTKQEIRLVKILPASDDGEICCEIFHFLLADLPPYRALSYTWGEDDLMHEIKMDDRSFWVYQNLYEFLRTIHTMIKCPTFYWVDQLCIDQDTVLEKNHQVGMMADIYRKAKEVTIWLGAETDHTHMVMQLIISTRVRRDFSIRDWVCPSSEIDPAIHYGITSLQGKRSKDRRTVCKDALIKLVTHVYWTRLWIVQEVVLSAFATVYWGRHHVELAALSSLSYWTSHCSASDKLDIFLGTYDSINIMVDEPSCPALEYLMLRYENRHSATTDSLYEAMTWLHKSKCKEPRDKLYAVLSFINTEHDIVIDYARELCDVFFDMVEAMTKINHFRGGAPMAPRDVSYAVWLCIQMLAQMAPKRLCNLSTQEVKTFVSELNAEMSHKGIDPQSYGKIYDKDTGRYIRNAAFESLMKTGWLVTSLRTFIEQRCIFDR